MFTLPRLPLAALALVTLLAARSDSPSSNWPVAHEESPDEPGTLTAMPSYFLRESGELVGDSPLKTSSNPASALFPRRWEELPPFAIVDASAPLLTWRYVSGEPERFPFLIPPIASGPERRLNQFGAGSSWAAWGAPLDWRRPPLTAQLPNAPHPKPAPEPGAATLLACGAASALAVHTWRRLGRST
ncbi:MAG: hypothetical protein U0836_26485 [Pirellulales bacterium]